MIKIKKLFKNTKLITQNKNKPTLKDPKLFKIPLFIKYN
jgi:hypothetical protein